MHKPAALMILNESACSMIYGPDERRDLEEFITLLDAPHTSQSIRSRPDLLSRAEVILSGWGGPTLDEAFLEAAPKLQAFFYAAGSLSGILTDAALERHITVTSAAQANAVPVAEYTFATIIFSLKHGWRLSRELRKQRVFDPTARDDAPGCYKRIVGLVSLGAIARKVLQMLRPMDLSVVVYDPHLSTEDAHRLGVTKVDLAELFRVSDVVSIHTPELPETEGMINGRLLSSMKSGATFINTARGKLVRTDELIAVAAIRTDLQFVLDVVDPEPLPFDSMLYHLDNVMLTPHIAGSAGEECRRMGRYMVEEVQRYVSGLPLKYAIKPESIWHTAHRPMSWRTPARTAAVMSDASAAIAAHA